MFRTVNEPFTIELKVATGTLRCCVQTRAVGQVSAGEGDDLRALAYVWLPCGPDTDQWYLHPELCFGDRVKIGGEGLGKTWGYARLTTEFGEGKTVPPGTEAPWRRSCQAIEGMGPTWTLALLRAERRALHQIAGLRRALRRRLRRFESDGLEQYVVKGLLPN